MRLTATQISAIRKSAAQLAGDAARVWLFGSRVRDDALGGDVDLLLELDEAVAEPAQLGRYKWFVRSFGKVNKGKRALQANQIELNHRLKYCFNLQ